jgi:hypothetical protein
MRHSYPGNFEVNRSILAFFCYGVPMAHRRSCLAGNRAAFIPLLITSLASVGFTYPVITERISVSGIGRAAPELLVLDIDDVDTSPLEILRMTRFVLPTCLIAVFSGTLLQSWARSCHIAGGNCILSKSSDESEIVDGLRQALTSGCFTDPGFAVA